MFEKPYFLGLFALALLALIWRGQRYYLRHAYLEPLQSVKSHKWQFRKILDVLGWAALILAAADFNWGYIEKDQRRAVHRFILLNDGSGSMVDRMYPRGVGNRLKTLIVGNTALLNMLDKRDDGSRDMVGALVFSSSAFIISYMVDDPKFLQQKLEMIDYDMSPLGQGTNIERALWAGLEMLVFNEKEISDDFRKLGSRMFGRGHTYKADDITKETIAKYQLKSKDGCLIVFTDAEFDNAEGGPNLMSTYKLLNLCKDLGVRVYVISVEVIDPFILRYVNQTGGYAQVFNTFEPKIFEKAYQKIVQSESTEEIVEKTVKHSLAPYFAAFALCLLLSSLFLKFTMDRNLTEV